MASWQRRRPCHRQRLGAQAGQVEQIRCRFPAMDLFAGNACTWKDHRSFTGEMFTKITHISSK
jgi:hypothetical protein